MTFGYLDKIPFREKLKTRLTEPTTIRGSVPHSTMATLTSSLRTTGSQNQNVYYIQKGENGKAKVFLDPNQFSADGTSVLSTFSPSKDAQYLAYGISQGGSDWVTLNVMEIATRNKLQTRSCG